MIFGFIAAITAKILLAEVVVATATTAAATATAIAVEKAAGKKN